MPKISSFGWLVFCCVIFTYSCQEKSLPKPEGYVRLEYPEAQYLLLDSGCSFQLEYSNQSTVERDSLCWYTLKYPHLKGSLYLTYYDINPSSLPQYIKQSEKLVYEHTIMASGIKPKVYVGEENKVFGTLYELMGESATNFQFYVTDSTRHFLQGSFYFRAKPQPDSLQPAVEYIKKDIFHIMQSVRWK